MSIDSTGSKTVSRSEREDMVKMAEHSRYIENLIAQGPLTLDRLLGDGWQDRSVSLDIVTALEKRTGLKIESIDNVTAEELEGEVSLLGRRLEEIDSRLSMVRGEDRDGTQKEYLLTSRSILTENGDKVGEVHELIDVQDSKYADAINPRSGNCLWAYGSKTIFLSTFDKESMVSKYLDLRALSPDDNIEFGMVNSTTSKEGARSKFNGRIAHLDHNFIGAGSIRTLDDLYSVLHEAGHYFYSTSDENWDEIHAHGRRLYKLGIEEDDGLSNYQARQLVSIDERFAWDADEQLITWLQNEFGLQIGLPDKLQLYQLEEKSLLSYDMMPYGGLGANPEAFSRAMRFFRNYYREMGGVKGFNIHTGERISHCPMIQIAQENNMTFEEYVGLLRQSGVLSESVINNLVDVVEEKGDK